MAGASVYDLQLSFVSSVQREAIDWLKSLRNRPGEVSMAPKLISIRTTLKYTIRKSVQDTQAWAYRVVCLQLPPTRGDARSYVFAQCLTLSYLINTSCKLVG